MPPAASAGGLCCCGCGCSCGGLGAAADALDAGGLGAGGNEGSASSCGTQGRARRSLSSEIFSKRRYLILQRNGCDTACRPALLPATGRRPHVLAPWRASSAHRARSRRHRRWLQPRASAANLAPQWPIPPRPRRCPPRRPPPQSRPRCCPRCRWPSPRCRCPTTRPRRHRPPRRRLHLGLFVDDRRRRAKQRCRRASRGVSEAQHGRSADARTLALALQGAEGV